MPTRRTTSKSYTGKARKNIIFIDNAEEFWINDMNIYANAIDYIRVPNASSNTEKTYTNNLAKNGNQYAKCILNNGSGTYVNKGIHTDIANSIKKWSEHETDLPKYALFDWDGTIAVTEGFSVNAFIYENERELRQFAPISRNTVVGGKLPILSKTRKTKKSTKRLRRFPGEPFNYKVRSSLRSCRKRHINYNNALQQIIDSPEYNKYLEYPLQIPSKEFLDDTFVYVMKSERIAMLRDLFRTLLQNNVKIHILTHNPYASVTNPFRPIFIELMWRLFNEDYNEEYESSITRNGTTTFIYQSSSHKISLLSRDELDKMLHSTMDYTDPGEPFIKRNIVRGLFA